jgi:hypothetical protein
MTAIATSTRSEISRSELIAEIANLSASEQDQGPAQDQRCEKTAQAVERTKKPYERAIAENREALAERDAFRWRNYTARNDMLHRLRQTAPPVLHEFIKTVLNASDRIRFESSTWETAKPKVEALQSVKSQAERLLETAITEDEAVAWVEQQQGLIRFALPK